jgi:Sulfotransferase family
VEATISESRPAGVEILDVKAVEPVDDRLRHFSLSAPFPGAQQSAAGPYAFDFEGWALGDEQRVASVDLTCDGLTMQRVMLNSRDPELRDKHAGTANQGVQGFYRRVNALRLTTEFELGIDALFEDKSRVAVGRLSGTRSQLPPGPDHELQPLMITTLGRSGSTAIINLLSSHPQVVAYRPTETETRVASYWVDAFTQLTEPSSYLRQLFPNDLRRGWWLGDAGMTPRLDEDPDTRQWLAATNVEELAVVARGRIESFYRHIASRVDRTGATYFVEKCQPRAGLSAPAMLDELYPRAREVVLVRDFRDMICSMFSYKKGKAFAPRHGQTHEEHVERLGVSALSLYNNWHGRTNRAHLLRYEEWVRDPYPTVEALLDYLELDTGARSVEDMVGVLTESGRKLDYHRTTKEQGSSIGRWQRDLDDDQLELVERAFGPALEGFGYS